MTKFRNPGPPMRMPKEDPEFAPGQHDKHTGKGQPGTMMDGTSLANQVYRQPWVEHDGVLDHDGKRHDG